MTEPATFAFDSEGLEIEHTVGDRECTDGWCGSEYPKPCEEPGCSGLVHANFGDENADGDYWVHTKCDVCGEGEA